MGTCPVPYKQSLLPRKQAFVLEYISALSHKKREYINYLTAQGLSVQFCYNRFVRGGGEWLRGTFCSLCSFRVITLENEKPVFSLLVILSILALLGKSSFHLPTSRTSEVFHGSACAIR